MHSWVKWGAVAVAVIGCQQAVEAANQESERINPMIVLHEQGQPVFGVYAPHANHMPAGETVEAKPMRQIAEEAIAYTDADYLFDGSMEDSGVDAGIAHFQEFMTAMHAAGATAKTHPLVIKMEKVSEDPYSAAHIGQQLNTGVSGIMFVQVESAEELERGLGAMRFVTAGGTRMENDLGMAPEYWGLSEKEYLQAADLWPLNPEGELISWVIIESLEGLENVREIAAVPGIGVLWPGAGTLRGVFSTENENGERVVDEEAWENAIQTVLSACNEFNLACGIPASPDNIEMRMAQGFDVFVMGWGDSGFETVRAGKKLASR